MSAARPETGATEHLTGATEEQLQRAVIAARGTYSQLVALGTRDPWPAVVVFIARQLVPPGTVIALAEHVVDAADREAIGYANDALHFAAAALEDETMSAASLREGLFEFVFAAHYREHLARLERLGSGGEGER